MATRPPLDPDSTINSPNEDANSTLTSRRDLLLGAVSMVAATAVPASAANPSGAAAAIPPSPTAKAAWHAFEVSLAEALADLDEDEFLTISPKGSNRFVQFLDQGAHGIRMETTSNVYLTGTERLSGSARRRLPAIGWHEPTSGSDEGTGPSLVDIEGSSNYFRDAPRPVPFPVLARIVAATFREFSIGLPGELEYDSGSVEDPDVALKFPALGLKRARRS